MFTIELLGYGHRATLLASPVHSVLKKPAPKLLDMLKPTDCFSVNTPAGGPQQFNGFNLY